MRTEKTAFLRWQDEVGGCLAESLAQAWWFAPKLTRGGAPLFGWFFCATHQRWFKDFLRIYGMFRTEFFTIQILGVYVYHFDWCRLVLNLSHTHFLRALLSRLQDSHAGMDTRIASQAAFRSVESPGSTRHSVSMKQEDIGGWPYFPDSTILNLHRYHSLSMRFIELFTWRLAVLFDRCWWICASQILRRDVSASSLWWFRVLNCLEVVRDN